MALEKVITHEPPCKVHGPTYRDNYDAIFRKPQPFVLTDGVQAKQIPDEPLGGHKDFGDIQMGPVHTEEMGFLFDAETPDKFTPEQEAGFERLKQNPSFRMLAGLDAPASPSHFEMRCGTKVRVFDDNPPLPDVETTGSFDKQVATSGTNHQPDNEWWCVTHKRVPTHWHSKMGWTCDPSLPGVLLPCHIIMRVKPPTTP